MPKFKYVPSASAVPDLTEPEQAQYNQLLDQAKKAIRPQQTVTQTQWIESRTAGYCARHPNVDKGIIVDIIRKAIDDKKLTSDFEITLDDATIVTVREILDDKEKYHGRRCHDPLEPEYHKDNRIGYINTKAPSPNIYSHAHGGQRFKLSNLKPTVILQPGKLNQVSDAIIEILSNEGKYYCYGNSIVKVTPTKLIRLTTETLAVEIHRSMNIGKILKAGETPTDIPIQMARTVYASASNHGPASAL